MAAQFTFVFGAQIIFSITAGMRATTTETAYSTRLLGNGASAASQDAVVVEVLIIFSSHRNDKCNRRC